MRKVTLFFSHLTQCRGGQDSVLRRVLRAGLTVGGEKKCEMELSEFYEFDSWPRPVAVQLVAREVGALVAVRRSVADVD